MSIRTEIRIAVGMLLLIQIFTSFGAIALLTRVTASIERILDENAAAIQAVEDMRAALAASRASGVRPELRQRFTAALDRARSHPAPGLARPALETVERNGPAALAGDPTAVVETSRGLELLTAAHHEAMIREEEAARRSGMAGAWAAVLLGVLGFGLSVVVVQRLSRQLLVPLHELHATVAAYRAGDRYRRCRSAGAPAEFQAAADTFNDLLDAQEGGRRSTDVGSAELDRAALLRMLDREAAPILVVDPQGRIGVANAAGMEVLRTDQAELLRAAAQRLSREGGDAGVGPGLEVESLGGAGWLIRVEPAAADLEQALDRADRPHEPALEPPGGMGTSG